MVVFTVLMIGLCRLTRGYIMPVYTLIGVLCAFANQLGWALVFFVLMPFFVILNPALVGNESSIYGLSVRLGPLLIGLILALRGASREGTHRLPFISMIPFLMVAAISSAGGWAPMVSYLKLVNFIVFLFGIWYGTQNLQQRPKDVLLLRSFFLAMACVMVFGSLLTILVPSIGYATSLQLALREGGVEYANDVFMQQQANSVMTLFCGITNHSQTLATLSALVTGFVLSDMLFLERRFRWLHILLIVFSLPLSYMTRSRVGFVSLASALGLVCFFTAHKISLPPVVKRHLNNGVWLGLLLILLSAVVVQFRGRGISQWLRKTTDAEGDRRSLGEALTSSRLGLIDYSLYEFRRNPLLGTGFQVAEYTPERIAKSKGLIISSPIEKGVTPVMVLGETGIIGEFFFLVFLASFCGICAKRKYYVTLSLFTVFLVTNIAESTFFSPGGGGGFMWMMSVVGGFTIDTYLLYRRQLEQQWAAIGFEMAPAFEMVEDRSGRRRMVTDERGVKRYGVKG